MRLILAVMLGLLSYLKIRIVNFSNSVQSRLGHFSFNSFQGNGIFSPFRSKVAISLNFAICYLRDWGPNRTGFRGALQIVGRGDGMTALVLGTGPSIGRLNWEAIAQDRSAGKLIVFGTNYLILQSKIPISEFDFLVLSDEGTFPEFDSIRTRDLWNKLRENPQLVVITPSSWHESNSDFLCRDYNACLHFNDNSLEWISKNINPTHPRGYASMTAYKAIAFAIHMRFEQVCISGIENTWYRGLRVTEGGRIFQDSIHVGDGYAEPIDMTDYYKNGVGDYFYDLALMFLSFKNAFGNQGNLLNLDNNSIIDFIPKVGERSPFSKYIRAEI